MKIANKPLNLQAIAIEEAETKIRLIVKDEYLKGTSKPQIDLLIRNVIKELLKHITIPALKNVTIRSLMNFYTRQYHEISTLNGVYLAMFIALRDLTSKEATQLQKNNAKYYLAQQGYDVANLSGIPLQKMANDYVKKHVVPVLNKLCEQYPYDMDDVKLRNSLRNRAEMEVRYNAHEEQIQSLKADGNKLVIASTHADCSIRCREWQGRVYSLDGTTGTTDDGREYVPLEEARNVIHQTNRGKKYINGLLGFNCRHYLVPYKTGFNFPNPNPIEERKQYMITLTQRQLERNVRKWRIEAITYKNTNKEIYLEAREKAIEWNNKYIEYSKKNNRAYYPSRTKLI